MSKFVTVATKVGTVGRITEQHPCFPYPFQKNPKNKSNCTEEKKMAIVSLCSDPYCHLDMIVSNIECPAGLGHLRKHLIKCHLLY